MERITTWNRKHVLLADALYAVIISIFFTLMAGTNDSNPGIIAYFDHTVMAFWSFVLMVPVAMRRWKPQMATLLFAGLVVVQLAFGPSMVYADLMAPWMLYSAIVYADPRNSKAFIVLAVAIGALASPVIIWSADAGPILNQGVSFDGLSPLETCSGTYIYGLSGDCATTIATSSVAIFIFIAVYLFAAIIVAYWQRARRITVSMMHERNDALQAKEDEERHIAALAERARIARDMHDVVAHTLSIIIIQSDGGRYAGANNPALARQTMETIRHESERALHDMKRLLGVFGGSDHADYADVDALIDQADAAAGMGCTIRKTVSGQPRVAALRCRQWPRRVIVVGWPQARLRTDRHARANRRGRRQRDQWPAAWRRLRGVRLRAVQHCLNAVRGCCAGVRKPERGVFRCGVFGRGNHADGGPDDRNGFNGDGYRECRGRQ